MPWPYEKALVEKLHKCKKGSERHIREVGKLCCEWRDEWYKHIVRDIDRFFRRGYKKNKSRITAIFIIDAIVKAEQKAFDNKKLKFAKRFATVLPHMFEACALVKDDLKNLNLQLSVWTKKNIYDKKYINMLKDKVAKGSSGEAIVSNHTKKKKPTEKKINPSPLKAKTIIQKNETSNSDPRVQKKRVNKMQERINKNLLDATVNNTNLNLQLSDFTSKRNPKKRQAYPDPRYRSNEHENVPNHDHMMPQEEPTYSDSQYRSNSHVNVPSHDHMPQEEVPMDLDMSISPPVHVIKTISNNLSVGNQMYPPIQQPPPPNHGPRGGGVKRKLDDLHIHAGQPPRKKFKNDNDFILRDDVDGDDIDATQHVYSPDHHILICGESNFSFTLSLAQKISTGKNLISTCNQYVHDKAVSNEALCKELNVRTLVNIDSLRIDCLQKCITLNAGEKFDRIIFTFPTNGARSISCETIIQNGKLLGLEEETPDSKDELHGLYVKVLLKCLSGFLRPGGTIDVMARELKNRVDPFIRWEVNESMKELGLESKKMFIFRNGLADLFESPDLKESYSDGSVPCRLYVIEQD